MHPYQALRTQLLAETRRAVAASVDDDQLIIQAVTLLEQLEQAGNRLAKKAREWYALKNPELERTITDHAAFLRYVTKKRPAQGVMGGTFTEEDTEALDEAVRSVSTLFDEKERLHAYLETLLRRRCANLQELAGTKIAGQLLAHAGNLQRLASVPSSTLQLYGAETALFRHLRDKRKHRSPKYGVLFNHPLVQNAAPAMKGRAARALADKLSLCAKIDLFKGERKADEYRRILTARFTAW